MLTWEDWRAVIAVPRIKALPNTANLQQQVNPLQSRVNQLQTELGRTQG